MKKKALFFMRKSLILALLYAITAGIFHLFNQTTYLENNDLLSIRLLIFIFLLPILVKFVIQLLSLFFYNNTERSRERRKVHQGEPIVSVLIPAFNEEVGIIKTIKSVLASRYPNIEVVVINDGSFDRTHELVSEFIQTFTNSNSNNHNNTQSIKYLNLTNGGKANALNQGLCICSGEFIITIDADCLMDELAITNTLKRFSSGKVGAVGGNVVVGNRNKPVELLQQLEYLYGFFFKRADSVFNSVYIIGGAAAAYRKSVLDEVGGFDPNVVTEDIEMSMRILAHGYKTRYAADAVTYTEGPSRWRCLFNQRLRWRFGRFQTFIKYRHLFFSMKPHHNRYFTMLLLPVALYAEVALLFQGVFLAIFYTYTLISHDFLPLVFVIVFMALMVCLQVFLDSKSQFHRNLLFLAPIAWLIFYIVDIIEFQALCRSLKRLIKNEGLTWQTWSRVGVLNSFEIEKSLIFNKTEVLAEPDVIEDNVHKSI